MLSSVCFFQESDTAVLYSKRSRGTLPGPTVAQPTPVLSLRDVVVYPYMVIPLFVGRERSIAALDESMNIDARDNYVFRWDKRLLQQILNSYYLESGYELNITIAWMSNKINANSNAAVRLAGAMAGRAFSFLPGCGGNQIMCFIKPGKELRERVNEDVAARGSRSVRLRRRHVERREALARGGRPGVPLCAPGHGPPGRTGQ